MGYMILPVTGFGSSRKEVGIFCNFITLRFCISFRIMFVKKAFDVAMSKTKLHLFNTYNHLSVLSYAWNKQCPLI